MKERQRERERWGERDDGRTGREREIDEKKNKEGARERIRKMMVSGGL